MRAHYVPCADIRMVRLPSTTVTKRSMHAKIAPNEGCGWLTRDGEIIIATKEKRLQRFKKEMKK